MTVVYDLLGVQSKEHGERGIARYVLNLALAIEKIHPNAVGAYLVRSELPLPGVLEPLIRSGKVRTAQEMALDPPQSGVFVVASPYELGEPLDSIVPHWARGPRWKRTGIVYDLIPMIFPDVYLTSFWHKRYRARTNTLRSLDHLFAISEASKTDAVRLLHREPDSITMIGAGADDSFVPPTTSRQDVVAQLQKRLPGLRPSYLLFPSGIEWRKNLSRMFEAYASLESETRRRHQLVMVCRTNEAEQHMLASEMERLGITDDFLATGFVTDDDLVRLYQGAELVIFPSLYEGFGLPVLEARQCGAPVVCSDNSSLVEVQPDPTARFDAEDVDAIAEVLRRTLGDPGERLRLRDSDIPPFSWAWAAERTLPELARLDQSARSTPTARKRLAVFSPLPPERSGIATYTSRLLGPIADQADITVFCDGDVAEAKSPAGIRVLRTSQFDSVERMAGQFDSVIYFIGNSEFHLGALAQLRKRPGAVLLHDVRMTGLYEMQYEFEPAALPHGTVGGLLRQWYPLNYRPHLYDELVILAPDADRFGIYLTREIASLATRLFTHSDFAANLIRLDSGVTPEVLFPIPVHHEEIARQRDQPPTVTTFGMLDPVKQPFLLLKAFDLVRQEIPNARLRFVGPVHPDLRERIDGAIPAHNLDAVEITGHVSSDRYRSELAATTVAVQLRAFTNGESSAAVADLIGAGIPTVVSDIGAMTELPPTMVRHVDSNASATALAAVLVELLTDHAMRDAMVSEGSRYSVEHSYEAASALLLRKLHLR